MSQAHPLRRLGRGSPLMRTLVIGDIHGCSRAFDTLLAAVQPSPDDQVITLGDYVDRGPDSAGVLQRILALEKTCHLTALLGNHERMMVDARDNQSAYHAWLASGGKAALASYGLSGDAATLADIPESHW